MPKGCRPRLADPVKLPLNLTTFDEPDAIGYLTENKELPVQFRFKSGLTLLDSSNMFVNTWVRMFLGGELVLQTDCDEFDSHRIHA